MDWMSLAIGAFLGGFLVFGVGVLFNMKKDAEAPMDDAAWRDKFEAAQAEAARYRAQLDNLQPSLAELERLKSTSVVPSLEAENRELKAQIQEMEKAAKLAPKMPEADEIAQAAREVVEAAKPVYHGAEPLDRIVGIGEERMHKLYEAGILTFKQLSHASPEHVAQILGIGQEESNLQVIYDWVNEAATLADEYPG
ncbi:MAG: hypothetical protein KF812_04185 [Fimbriimonadaceae bacterium]|nr:hypothetical protein [Fimbriimonadaceae bacterium]